METTPNWLFLDGHCPPTVTELVFAPTVEIDPKLVDRLIELYCDWRVAHAQAAGAYERFSTAPVPDRTLAFAAYGAALDREQCACEAYAAHIHLVQALCAGTGS
jgi:hypothetical protein